MRIFVSFDIFVGMLGVCIFLGEGVRFDKQMFIEGRVFCCVVFSLFLFYALVCEIVYYSVKLYR